MIRESRPRGWDGRFRRVYVGPWTYVTGAVISNIIPVVGGIFWANLFVVDGYSF